MDQTSKDLSNKSSGFLKGLSRVLRRRTSPRTAHDLPQPSRVDQSGDQGLKVSRGRDTSVGDAPLSPSILVHRPTEDDLEAVPSSLRLPSTPRERSVSKSSHVSILTATSRPSEDSAPDPIPDKVTCALTITERIPGSDLTEKVSNLSIRWTEPGTFELLEEEARKLLGPVATQRRNGTVQIVCGNSDQPKITVRHREQWGAVQHAVAGFAAGNPYKRFQLKVCWDYIRYQPEPEKGKSFALSLRDTIHGKMLTNHKHQLYISRIDVEKIMSPDVIAQLLAEEKMYPEPEIDRKSSEISAWAPRLLGLCVWGQCLLCFRQLFDGHIDDEYLPFARDTVLPIKNVDRDTLYDNQGKFCVHTFPPNGWKGLLEIRKGFVLPIHYDEKRDFVGKGNDGKVFKATIENNHHPFSADPAELFALKRFHDRGSLEIFAQEVNILNQLAESPHPHIVVHLAAFIHEDVCFMLFPYAQCNLRTLMREKPKPAELNRAPVLWLLGQLAGLAGALARIHTFRNGSDTVQGYHHDIKPENILVFMSESASIPWERCVLKLADFGCGKMKPVENLGPSLRYDQVLSIQTYNERGTITYQGPDADITRLGDKRIARPFDLWSLGCVFLELLNWFFINGPDPKNTFSKARMNDPSPTSNLDQFWQQAADSADGYILRPSVTAKIVDIEQGHSALKPAFQGIVTGVRECLEIQPSKRISAAELSERLRTGFQKAKRDLDVDKYCYYKQGQFKDDGTLIKQPPINPSKTIKLHGSMETAMQDDARWNDSD